MAQVPQNEKQLGSTLALLKIGMVFKVYAYVYKSAFQHYKMMHLQHFPLFLHVELHVLTRAESMRGENATRISC